MEVHFDADFVEVDEESSGTLVRRNSKVDPGRNLKENGANDTGKPEMDGDFVTSDGENIDINSGINSQENAANRIFRQETKMNMNFAVSDEESSGTLVLNTSELNTGRNLKEKEANGCKIMIGNMEVGFNEVQNGEVKLGGERFEAEQSQVTKVERTERHENKEYLNGRSIAYSLSMDPSNKSAVLTDMPVDSTHPKASSELSVYYVEDKGLWKCRHCSWVYAAIKPGIDLIQKHKEHCEGMNNEKALFEQVFPIKHEFQMGSQINATLDRGIKTIDYESKETEFVMSDMVNQTMTEMKNDQKWPTAEGICQSNYMDSETSTGAYVTQSSVTGKFNQIEDIKNGKSAFLDMHVFSAIASTATVRTGELASNEVQEKTENAGIIEHQHGASKIVLQISQDGLVRPKDEKQLSENQIRILEKSALEGKVEDIVKILKEQQSHDLVCPNCGSCITKHVILRKRKWTSQVSEDSNDVQAAVSEEEYEITEDQSNRPEMPIEQGTVAYGCLACFWFIIGRVVPGVKLFQTKSESGNDSLAEQYTSENHHDSRMLVDKDKDSFYCFPFRYPWGHSKPRDKLTEPLLNKEDSDKEMPMASDESNSYGRLQSVKYSTGLQPPGDKLKEPLLNKEDSDRKMAMALDESNSYGRLQSVKYSSGLQLPGDKLKEPLLNKEDSDKEMAMALDESNSYGRLQSVKYSSGLQLPGDKLKELLLNKEDSDKEMPMALDESNSYGRLQSIKYSSGLQLPGAKADYVIGTSQRKSGKQVESIPKIMPSESNLRIADTLQQNEAVSEIRSTTIGIGSMLTNDGEKATTVNEVGLDEHDTFAENAKLDSRLNVYDKDDVADKEFTDNLSNRVARHTDSTIQNIRSQTSTTTKSTLTYSSRMETVEIKETKYRATEITKSTQYLDGDSESLQLEEHYPRHPNLKMTEGQFPMPPSSSIPTINGQTGQAETKFEVPNESVPEKESDMHVQHADELAESKHSEKQHADQKDVKGTEDQLTELHFSGSSFLSEEHRQGKTEQHYVYTSSKHLDKFPREVETSMDENRIRPQLVTQEQAFNDMSASAGNKEFPRSEQRPENLEGNMVVSKGQSVKKDYLCSCIPVSIPAFWSILSSKEVIADQQLKKPLLANLEDRETIDKEVPVALKDDQQRKVISPLKSGSIESSSSLETRDPATLAQSKVDDSVWLNKVNDSVSQSSEIFPDSGNIVIPADGRVATAIDIVQMDDHQPSNAGTSVSELTKIPKREVQNLNVVTDWDLLKSIVYGGLTVSITSLGVVSSAAGGGAKTLTVIAISLANLVAGFFLIINNLLYLGHSGEFVETVGCRPWFNGFIAILSYLIFGSLAPITYGFSFQKSDDIVYKFFAASLVSLISIILLALGKARVTKKSYIRSVILYVVTGFWASIIGFFAGKYIKKLLEKWGFTTD